MATTEYGLIGRVLGHSYSAKYFNEKFQREGIDARYDLYPLATIDLFPHLLERHPRLAGLNVTIPYKVDVMRYLDSFSEEAEGIGAVNVIKITRIGDRTVLKGYNSDAYGFSESLKNVMAVAGYDPGLHTGTPTALVLGTGGASKAVVWSLKRLGFAPQLVGRTHRDDCLQYGELTPGQVNGAALVVNCTPLGTSPDTDKAAPFPYQYLRKGQICFDLVYNPAETLFMRICKAHGCTVSNGLEMLRLQAVGAWRVWENENGKNEN